MFFVGDADPRKKVAHEAQQEALRLCGVCVVTAACLEYALRNKEAYGIWGGMTTKERKSLARKRLATKSSSSI